jgi:hypothetical protein
LKTSRDINSNETREENGINRRIFSVRITLLRVSFLFIHLCVHLESVKDGQFSGIFSVFFVRFGKNASHWRRRISISKDVKHTNARL